MEFQVNFKVNAKIFLKDPETSEIGKQIVRHSIDLINNLGFEQFTFKKLASDIGTTEATVYRYFENKYRILLYILNWYWSYMEFLLIFRLQNVHDKHERIRIVINLLTHELPDSTGLDEYNKKSLNQIVIAESSKVYLVKEVSEINKNEVFKPYKDLCSKISEVITDYNPTYKYPKSLSTTIIETAHQQQFFSNNLPRLTDNTSENTPTYTSDYIEDMVFKILG
ncbi:MAG: TetR/AcrR family transcriptional regulator [Flavobacteriales bacterium]|nr:TetR/AcrR family transcriptional regulator [Flavobacteriales bacterium]